MKRSLIRSLTALAAVSLFMLSFAPAANAAPWGLAIESGMRSAAWFESARQWMRELLGLVSAPAPKNKQKAVQQGRSGGGDEEAHPNGDEGVCLDPGGNRVPCRF